jgi:hypothetical protein
MIRQYCLAFVRLSRRACGIGLPFGSRACMTAGWSLHVADNGNG